MQEEEAEQAKVNADLKSPTSYNELQGDANLTRSTSANTRSSIVLFDNNKDNISNDRKVLKRILMSFQISKKCIYLVRYTLTWYCL